jgi:hypothetical protein
MPALKNLGVGGITYFDIKTCVLFIFNYCALHTKQTRWWFE